MPTPAADELAAVLATTVDAIIVIDENGTIESFNAAATRIFGYAAEECVGQPVTMLMDEPHHSQHKDYVTHYLRTGEARIIGIGRELTARHRSGRAIPIYLAVSEFAARGRRRFTGIIRDLTEARAAREALAKQREELAHVARLTTMGEMTASIAHEINQPLTAIAMYAQAGMKMIDAGTPNLERLRAALEKLNTQALRAGAVIERIQRFAKAQESRREVVNVNDLLVDLMALAETDMRLHDVRLNLHLADDLPSVLGDPVALQQVALNLIRNAIDATLEIDGIHGRALEILTHANKEENQVVVEVRDHGPGVAADRAPLLFAPFHTTKREGMGMGLSICRSIVVEHGGELKFRNNTPNMTHRSPGDDHGATFYFTLPIASEISDND